MLIKEYRIFMPLSVEDYRIAQLYMIQKKTREETEGAGSGVEILKNEPYSDGPGGSGQYTHKLYHVASHVPNWFRSLLPSSMVAVEEAWNAYPYTKTMFSCPFFDSFHILVETRYFDDDDGTQENVFALSDAELKQRQIDRMDIVNDTLDPAAYKEEEDPAIFKSVKTGHGPLCKDWIDRSLKDGKHIMCAYKLVKAEFKYWGVQSKVESFIHNSAIRKTMLRAHRQAWCWLDEWYGLSIEDIRRMERETQKLVNRKMREALKGEAGDMSAELNGGASTSIASEEYEENPPPSPNNDNVESGIQKRSKAGHSPSGRQPSASPSGSHSSKRSASRQDTLKLLRSNSEESMYYDAADGGFLDENGSPTSSHKTSMIRWSSVEIETTPPPSPFTGRKCPTALLILLFHGGSPFDQANMPGAHIQENGNVASDPNTTAKQADLQTLRTTFGSVIRAHFPQLAGRVAVQLVPCISYVIDALSLLSRLSAYGSSAHETLSENCCNPVLVTALSAASDSYETALIAAIQRANQVFQHFLQSDEGLGFQGEVCIIGDCLGGLLAYDALLHYRKTTLSRNPSSVSAQSNLSTTMIPEDDEKQTPSGVFYPGDLDSQCLRRSSHDNVSMSNTYTGDSPDPKLTLTPPPSAGIILQPPVPASVEKLRLERSMSTGAAPSSHKLQSPLMTTVTAQSVCNRRLTPTGAATTSSSTSNHSQSPASSRRARSSSFEDAALAGQRLNVRVSRLFLFGSPLGSVLVGRKIAQQCRFGADLSNFALSMQPACNQMFNLYYPIDPCAARIEPLLSTELANLAPVAVPRYSRSPLGDGRSHAVADHLRTYLQSQDDGFSNHTNGTAQIQLLLKRWWGDKRIDFALYCPEGLETFPQVALPNILHASYWESQDVVSFILRQFVVGDEPLTCTSSPPATAAKFHPNSFPATTSPLFTPPRLTEKWSHRGTSFKIKNANANHRGNDAIALEGQPQRLHARFMYGPLDVIALTKEKVDVYVCHSDDNETNGDGSGTAGSGEWVYCGTETTDSHGRLSFSIPEEKHLPLGVHAVKMVVCGDHTYLNMFLAVVPAGTNCVVFSIDGSFTASVSVTGKDPKVRPGAVDVVRHWQDLGYLILYMTARPDMQQRQVVGWLTRHNFPHGLLFFAGGITSDPLRQKTVYLRSLVEEQGLRLQAAYGSSKDIHVYAAAGLEPDRIFIIGKGASKKACRQITEGYAAHLVQLSCGELLTVAKPVPTNGRLVLRKGFFSLPGQFKAFLAVQRSHSFTPRSGKYETQRSVASSTGSELVVDSPGLPQRTRSSRGLSPFRLARHNKGDRSSKD